MIISNTALNQYFNRTYTKRSLGPFPKTCRAVGSTQGSDLLFFTGNLTGVLKP